MTTINDYLARLYAERDDLTRNQFVQTGQLKDFAPVVDDDVARFLKVLLHTVRPRRVLEIGTGIGYSTTRMASIIKEYQGKIVTVESDEQVARQAQMNFDRAGVAHCIQIKIGDAVEVVPRLPGEFDLIFLDVDKRLYPRLLLECIRLLRAGGLLVAEDTLFPVIDLDAKWRHLIPPIEEFNGLVAAHPEIDSTILPVGDGVTIAVKKQHNPAV